ncbi:carbohydrate ABC transporter permease [Clostridium estertheticum]|uniref:ABC transporter permease n=1 Tax=Clostridium estertheticum subsp. estertheticum TaxID=1552 RepID=A0A1J0GFN5_9CLOT|nr:carbohydrate ABC transporter permease [Clostridium estertheticum]APC40115.1 ABC transporter permease [Clostridium estertheticum subsp. estertheticum]MBU3170334.1 carbohydrate ABC transporter permease [Clostridium estertheticum]MBU3186260.1 carbohydrate ABC transporter permease [Clostridium estertheticum]MBZ9618102.1 carbohydrate ABC transporter permease [Clostridium estertheticum subsp. laramiense]MCB2307019.1 carbohydrate ABC transporter permease [Clostridium estertheticum]
MNTKLLDKILDIIVFLFISIVVLLCLVPLIHVAAVSFSSSQAVVAQKVTLLPVDFTMESYKQIFNDKSMITSLFFTIKMTVIYTVLSMVLTICAAYPLTKSSLKGRDFFFLLIIITMYFSGGIIPDYILVKDLSLLNSMWGLILPGAISVFNLIILKTFFQNSIPNSLEESAKLDGCTEIGILFKIVLPLSMPIIATLSLFYAVGRWNGFQDALFYITKPELYPLQLKLYQLVSATSSNGALAAEGVGAAVQLAPDVLKASVVMFATVPILLIYPWLQRYFVSGVMIGAVKE